ncbi:MAG TPA: hypothetical protein VM056_01445 [Terriglobales bacterium]|nr:hypothetical protein [Terriglobales bacterium]
MNHLNEDQFAECAIGIADAATTKHLAECSACRDEAESLKLELGAFGQAVRSEAETRPPQMSSAQIRAMASQRSQANVSKSRLWRLLPVPALAAAIVLGVVLMKPPVPPPSTAVSDAADDALLLRVSNDVYRATPSALQPARFLHKERNDFLTIQKKKNEQGNLKGEQK